MNENHVRNVLSIHIRKCKIDLHKIFLSPCLVMFSSMIAKPKNFK